jgi:hypothetical protein
LGLFECKTRPQRLQVQWRYSYINSLGDDLVRDGPPFVQINAQEFKPA